MKKFLMLHGINHNMFGKRDPVQYGTITLGEIDDHLKKLGRSWASRFRASRPQRGRDVRADPQAFLEKFDASSSTPARGRITATAFVTPCDPDRARRGDPHVEHPRPGEFRHHSVFGEIVKGQICGFGLDSYLLACAPRFRPARPTNPEQNRSKA
jgi:3-dehydroquinate dehydratase-2